MQLNDVWGALAISLLTALIGVTPLVIRVTRGTLSRISVAEFVPVASGVFFGISSIVAFGFAKSLGLSAFGNHRSIDLTGGAFAYLLFTAGAALALLLIPRDGVGATGLSSAVSILKRAKARHIVVVAGFVWLVRLYAGSRYALFYSGSGTTWALDRVPYWLSVSMSLADTLGVAIPAWAYLRVRHSRIGIEKILAVSLLLGESYYMFAQGRRAFLFLVVLIAVLHMVDTGFLQLRGMFLFTAAIVVSALFIFPRLLGVRYVLSHGYVTNEVSAQKQFYLATKYRLSSGKLEGLYLENMALRSGSYLAWAAEVVEGSRATDYLMGKAVADNLAFVVPSALIPEKRNWSWGETLINRHYDIARSDSPNSVAIAGLADFGFFGCVLYGMLFSLLLALGERISVLVSGELQLVAAISLLQLFAMAVLAEQSLVHHFATLRNIALFMIAAAIWRLVVAHKTRSMHAVYGPQLE